MGRSLQTLGSPLAQPRRQLELLDEHTDASFQERLEVERLWPLNADTVDVLQLNVGRVCNQTCRHCHVDAGPDRREQMSHEVFEDCLDALERIPSIATVDITGGAPEMNPSFRWFVERCRSLGRHVMDRCNLTIIETKTHADLPEFLAGHQVEVVASLPHYRPLATDAQRGDGVFDKSLAALKKLNAVGYADDPALRLSLVTNPAGAFLPGDQAALEKEWKRELLRRYGIRFNSLFTITNMPIARFLDWLHDSDNLSDYMARLLGAFNPGAVSGVMCRSMLSVGYDGRLYDCDFNQMLELELSEGMPRHIRDLDADSVKQRAVRVHQHCFGCTAGLGSSCGGATV